MKIYLFKFNSYSFHEDRNSTGGGGNFRERRINITVGYF